MESENAMSFDRETHLEKTIQEILENDILPIERAEILESISQVMRGTQRLRNIFLLMGAQARVTGNDKGTMLYQTQFKMAKVIYDCLEDILSRMEPDPPEEEDDDCKQGPKEEMPKTAEPKEASAR